MGRSRLRPWRSATSDNIWSAGLILFGAHLVVIGALAYRSGFVPRLISALPVLAVWLLMGPRGPHAS
jgi:hypothetical protein